MMLGVPTEVASRARRRGRQPVWVAGGGPFRVMRHGELHGYGIGDAASQTAGGAAVPVDSFMAGIGLWLSPAAAFSALGPAVSGFGSHPMTSLGLLIPPIILAVLLFTMVGGRKR